MMRTTVLFALCARHVAFARTYPYSPTDTSSTPIQSTDFRLQTTDYDYIDYTRQTTSTSSSELRQETKDYDYYIYKMETLPDMQYYEGANDIEAVLPAGAGADLEAPGVGLLAAEAAQFLDAAAAAGLTKEQMEQAGVEIEFFVMSDVATIRVPH